MVGFLFLTETLWTCCVLLTFSTSISVAVPKEILQDSKLSSTSLLRETRSAERCTTREGRSGSCVPQFECSSIGNVEPTICKTFAFFSVICCPDNANGQTKGTKAPTDPLQKLRVANCGIKSIISNNPLFKRAAVQNVQPAFSVKPTHVPTVVGGVVSESNSWPWMAAIFTKTSDKGDYLCGGTIINDRYILTAGHCFKSSALSRILPEWFVVRLAEHDITDSDDGDRYEIEKLIVHEEFKPPVFYNDIALLKLKNKIRFTSKVQSVCLPLDSLRTMNLENKDSTIIGWGITSFAGRDSAQLREVVVPVTSNSFCDQSYKRIKATSSYPQGIINSQLCAGFRAGGKDACQGDSGGPLMIRSGSNKWTLVGVVSGGYQCARPNFPGVYTRVTHYLNWIANNID